MNGVDIVFSGNTHDVFNIKISVYGAFAFTDQISLIGSVTMQR